MSKPMWITVVLATLPFATIFALIFFIIVIADDSAADELDLCTPAGSFVDLDDLPKIDGYDRDQIENAAHIINAGAKLGATVRDQEIAVMTALGESSLYVLDRGDDAGPDSRGLFQQRANGAWGTYEDRMDPHRSATNFYKSLMQIEDRAMMAPTLVAHRVQRNADPYHYERFSAAARDLVAALIPALDRDCFELVPGAVADSGWAQPGSVPITSLFGMRFHPIDRVTRLHAGVDLQAGGCDGPIWAANDGIVTFAGLQGNLGLVTIEHTPEIKTRYLHMEAYGILVDVGQRVQAGQQIARVGSTGASTACHLHFEVLYNNNPVDPLVFLESRGIDLRAQ